MRWRKLHDYNLRDTIPYLTRWMMRIKYVACVKDHKTHRRFICMYIQNFIMEYSVESVFPVNANGLHNITQWKTKPIYNPQKKKENPASSSTLLPSVGLLLSTLWKPRTHPTASSIYMYIPLTIPSWIRLATRFNSRARGHAAFLLMLRWDGGKPLAWADCVTMNGGLLV